jgi:succinate dehydrogenase/fumarate reductase flavoprotein subunit
MNNCMTASDFDIVVVGGGGAGLMAAYSAASLGRSVIVLEKQPDLGGTTALSVGTICTSSTPHQQRAGIIDSPDAHFEDMGKFPGALPHRDNPALRRLLVDHVPEVFRLLLELGVEFVGPIAEPPHRVSRLHAIVPHARGYIGRLSRACRRHGVIFRTSVAVHRLVIENGRVRGVETAASGGAQIVRARCVILASGDFSSADRAFKARFMQGPLLQIGGINPASTGDGQRLGEAAGGEIVNGDLAWGPEIRFVAPKRPKLLSRVPPWRPVAKLISTAMRMLPDKILRPLLMSYVTTYLAPSHNLFREGAVLVNANGERFCDERDRPQDRIGDEPGQQAFIAFDQDIAAKFDQWPNFISTAPGVGYAYFSDYRRSRRDVCFEAPTWQELAQATGLPAGALARTMAAYDAECGARARPALGHPPFFALGPAKSWIVFTEGGLRVNEKLQVLGAGGTTIAGLYGAGSAGQGGVLLEGHGHHLAWAFTSGRLAGRYAAEEAASIK